jgi:hypothetical protein
MLDPVTAAAEEVTCTTVFSGRPTHALGHLVPVWGIVSFFIAFKNCLLDHRVSGPNRKFFISTGLFVTNQTVDFCLIRKIETFTLPTVTCMA